MSRKRIPNDGQRRCVVCDEVIPRENHDHHCNSAVENRINAAMSRDDPYAGIPPEASFYDYLNSANKEAK